MNQVDSDKRRQHLGSSHSAVSWASFSGTRDGISSDISSWHAHVWILALETLSTGWLSSCACVVTTDPVLCDHPTLDFLSPAHPTPPGCFFSMVSPTILLIYHVHPLVYKLSNLPWISYCPASPALLSGVCSPRWRWSCPLRWSQSSPRRDPPQFSLASWLVTENPLA